ncbi:MAG: hypothetical protein GY795_10860 [Desulfobacterales bacterium]|nr:hypothetical protein [Desulfobacterales bacterium]
MCCPKTEFPLWWMWNGSGQGLKTEDEIVCRMVQSVRLIGDKDLTPMASALKKSENLSGKGVITGAFIGAGNIYAMTENMRQFCEGVPSPVRDCKTERRQKCSEKCFLQ